MLQNGHLKMVGGAQIKNMRPEILAVDPDVSALFEARVWWNTTEKALKFYDGATVETIAVGGNLEDYIRADGTVPMLADLLLSSASQVGADAKAAVSKGHVETELAKKQDTVTGAATTIVAADLTASKAVVSDSNGKVAVASASVAEVDYLVGVTAPLQTQIDGKQATIGYIPVNKAGDSMDGDLALQGHKLIGLGAPVAPTDAARKIDIENALAGMNWQDDVDGVQADATLVPVTEVGKRYILTDIAALAPEFGVIAGVGNGDIVEYDGTEFVVVYDLSSDSKSLGTITFAYDSQQFVRYELTGWKEFGGLAALNAGVGLRKEGNVLNINLGAGIAELPSDEVGLDLLAAGGLTLADVDGIEANRKLAVKLADASLTMGVDGVKLAAGGVHAAHVAADTLGMGLQGGDGVTLSVKVGEGIVVDAEGVALDTTFADARYVNVDGDSITSLLITGAITDAKSATTKEYADAIQSTLNDAIVAVADRLNSGTFVYDGTVTAQQVHTVTHGLGFKYGTVTVLDENDYVIGVDEIHFVDDNSFTVEFVGAQKCKVIFSGKKVVA